MPLLSRLLCVLVLAVLIVVAGSASAGAHNSLEAAEPADGATVTAGGFVTLRFTAPVPLDTMTVEAADASGNRTSLTGLRHGSSDREVIVPLESLGPGPVTLRWRLVGPDGHIITERLRYAVEQPAAATTAPPSAAAVERVASPTPIDADDSSIGSATRWLVRLLGYLAIMTVVGIVAIERLVWPGVTAQPSWAFVRTVGFGAVAVLAAVQLAQLAGQIRGRPAWSSLGALPSALQTTLGQALAVRVALAAGGAVLLLIGSRLRYRHQPLLDAAVAVLAGLLLATWSMGGHARSMRWPFLGVPLDVAHHAAAATWLGGLAVVGVVGLRTLEPDEAQAVVQRFSSVAPWAVGVLVVTGLLTSIRLIDSVAALGDAHSRVLAAKLAVLAAMLWVANVNRRRLRRWAARATAPRSGQIGALRRAMTTELVTGLVVVAFTAALVVTTPSTG